MKFNWGTGIFTFLVLFVLGGVAFIFFASRQHVNLVHKDYYEKGVDYSEQMKVEARSKKYSRSVKVNSTNDFVLIEIEHSLAERIDSGSVLLFRPSNSRKDVLFKVQKAESEIIIPKENLIHGRYILKFYWYTDGLKYEVDQPLNIQ